MSTQVTVVGHLTADPELRFTPGGKAVANFTIASNIRKLNPNTQQWEDGNSTFLRGAVWETVAENLAESLTRGAEVIAEGMLEQRDFVDKDENKRSVIELKVRTLGVVIGKFNTVKVTKLERVAAGAGQRSDDPWSSSPNGSQGSFTEEPPF